MIVVAGTIAFGPGAADIIDAETKDIQELSQYFGQDHPFVSRRAVSWARAWGTVAALTKNGDVWLKAGSDKERLVAVTSETIVAVILRPDRDWYGHDNVAGIGLCMIHIAPYAADASSCKARAGGEGGLCVHAPIPSIGEWETE
ncbi:hypothetical protein ACQEVF_57520 [Nonomuraea polychroma]|uniref:hypothetical protein n=1 Tax=Nonomuraea polychroma TaxID=46176 RepID=UPI003D908B18